MNVWLTILFLIAFWAICNMILKTILKKTNMLDEFSKHALNNRKNIAFDIIILLVLAFLNLKIFNWIAIVYFIIMFIVCGVLLLTSIFHEIPYNKKIIKQSDIPGCGEEIQREILRYKKIYNILLWLVFSNFINELSNILMVVFIFNNLKL